jgi:predicted amidohydrolase YtcJ/ABC-type multidrug transport system permease subunit
MWLLLVGAGYGAIARVDGTSSYQAFVFPGIVVMASLFGAMLTAISTVYDREFGMLRLMLACPSGVPAVLAGRAVAAAAVGFLHGIIVLATAPLFVPVTLVQAGLAVGVLAVTSASSSVLGLLVAAPLRSVENFAAVVNVVLFPLLFLSGALYPTANMPPWLHGVAVLNPVTYAVDLMRVSLGQSAEFPVALSISALVGAIVLAFAAAAMLFDPEQRLALPGARRVRNTSLWLAVAGSLAVLEAQRPDPPDLILHNSRIYTVDAKRSVAEAVAIKGDRFLRVGRSADVLALRGPSTRVIDLRGATVLPGLHDAHGHVVGFGASMQNLDLRGTRSFEEVVGRVRRRVADVRRGEWILGRGWDQNDWAEHDWPTHEILSAASPDNPVYLARIDGHAGLANQRAMSLAGLDRSTADPPGGRIMRDADGRPTGVLVDTAEALVTARIPRPGRAQLEDQMLLAERELRRLGVTTVHDAGTDPAIVEIYKGLIDAGKLKTRLYVMLAGSREELAPEFKRGPLASYGNHRLAVRAVKMFADGALGSRGAALLEPYSDEPGTSGLLTTPPDVLYAQTFAAAAAGFQVAIHAIGDRGNRIAMDTFERVQREVPGAGGLRMRIEHAQILDAAEIPRFSRLGVIASMQPTHATSDMPWAAARIGDSRVEEGAYVWRKLRASGAVIASGSDFPVEEANPMLGIYAAVTRQDLAGSPGGGWTPGQRMMRDEALASFTKDAAYAAHAEQLSGSIEAGKLADLVVLSADIMQAPPREIPTTTVRMTIVGGEIVFESRTP